MINFRQLRAFDAVVRLGSFAKAAQALHVTPAALSLSLREMEDRLGFRVLERTTRSLRLTEAGRGYLVHAQRVLTEIEEAERYAREVQQGHVVVRIATTQTVIATLLAAAFAEAHARFPTLRLHPVDVPADTIGDTLPQRQADIAVGVRLPSDEAFASRPFFTSTWHAFCSPHHPFGRKRRLTWAELATARLYMNKSTNLHLQALLGHSFPPMDVQDTTTASAGFAMASMGLGVAVFPGYARPLAQVGGLRTLAIQDPVLPHVLEIGSARQPSTSAPLRAIEDVLIEATARECAHLAS